MSDLNQLGGTGYVPGSILREMEKHSSHLYHAHLSTKGLPYAFTQSAVPPIREELIAGVMAVRVTVFGPRVNCQNPVLRQYYPEEGEATAKIDALLGHRLNEEAA
jgi:hypothetical protein